LEVEGARQRGRPNKTWKEVVDKDMDDLHIKLTDAMDRSKWMTMIRGNWRTVMPRTEYELDISGVSSPRLIWGPIYKRS